MAKVDAGELLARSLAAAGVHDVFALHGGHLDSFLQACSRNGVRLIDTRHESTAGHAAEAYARTTGRVGGLRLYGSISYGSGRVCRWANDCHSLVVTR